MRASAIRKILIPMLFLVLAFSFNLTRLPDSVSLNNQNLITVIVPERLRGFIAARLWEKADDYMHSGPAPNKAEPFTAGSYAGNTDILPLLQIITRLVPSEPAPWLLLADNLARFLGSFDQAVGLLQQAIIYQPEISKIHQFYAAIAYLKLFARKPDKKAKKSALNYLQTAIEKFEAFSNKPAMHGYDLKSYFLLLARLQLETGNPEKALKAWKKTKLPLTSDQGMLASLLINYEKTGKSPDLTQFIIEESVADKSKNLIASEAICQHPAGYHEHNHNTEHAHLSGRASASIAALIIFSLTIVVKKVSKP